MPLYVYHCAGCGARETKLLRVNDATPKRVCETSGCGGVAQKQVTAPQPPVFKGTGFYVTDFKNQP